MPAHEMHTAWQRLLPGFAWISWGSFFLGLIESYAYGWFFTLIWVPLYNVIAICHAHTLETGERRSKSLEFKMEEITMIRFIRLVVLRAAIALVVVAGSGAVMMVSGAQAQSGAAETSPAASPQATTKGAMECCKLGKGGAANKGAAMECCKLGMKGMTGVTGRDAAMECCRLGMKGAPGGPSGEEAPKREQK